MSFTTVLKAITRLVYILSFLSADADLLVSEPFSDPAPVSTQQEQD